MSCYTFYVESDCVYVVRGVRNSITNEYVNDADVQLTLKDENGVNLAGSWPLTLDYVLESDGDYQGTVQDASLVAALAGTLGTAVIDIDGDGLQRQLTLPVQFETADQQSLSWSSRQELEDVFGRNNVRKWADLDNDLEDESDADTVDVSRRIQTAIDRATEDVKVRLQDGPTDIEALDCAPVSLRYAVTQLAGVRLYEARGVKDTTDEEGRHRLTYHKKEAEKFIDRVNAGQIRLNSAADAPTAYPKFVDAALPTDDDDNLVESPWLYP